MAASGVPKTTASKMIAEGRVPNTPRPRQFTFAHIWRPMVVCVPTWADRQSQMPRHRHDLREYWRWYERAWTTLGGRAVPPPFTLEDIAPLQPTSARKDRAMRVGLSAVALLLVV